MLSLEALFAEIEARHYLEPAPDPAAIDEFARLHNYPLPRDLKAFYRTYSTAKLFSREGSEAVYHFVPISRIRPTKIDLYGKGPNEWGPDTWLTICDVRGSNYIAIDVESGLGDEFAYIDCFHETFAQPGECRIVAKSFRELLDRALRSQGTLYYLDPEFIGYGDGRPLTPENASLRIDNPEAPKKGWLVKFTIPNSKRSYHKFFPDDEHGGPEAAFEAVRKYVQESRP